MGEPAIPPPAEREATRALALAIVESVRNDEEMPLPLDVVPVHGAGEYYRRVDVQELVFRLAQELVLSSRVLWAECQEPPDRDGVPACAWTGEMGQLDDRGDGVLRCPNCGSTAIKEDINA